MLSFKLHFSLMLLIPSAFPTWATDCSKLLERRERGEKFAPSGVVKGLPHQVDGKGSGEG